MRRQKPQLIRNKLDLTDRRQVRIVKKRLRLSEAALVEIVGKIGNSISAISKEVALQRASRAPSPAQVTNAALIASDSVNAASEAVVSTATESSA
jgi:hypothetical protein